MLDAEQSRRVAEAAASDANAQKEREENQKKAIDLMEAERERRSSLSMQADVAAEVEAAPVRVVARGIGWQGVGRMGRGRRGAGGRRDGAVGLRRATMKVSVSGWEWSCRGRDAVRHREREEQLGGGF